MIFNVPQILESAFQSSTNIKKTCLNYRSKYDNYLRKISIKKEIIKKIVLYQ